MAYMKAYIGIHTLHEFLLKNYGFFTLKPEVFMLCHGIAFEVGSLFQGKLAQSFCR